MSDEPRSPMEQVRVMTANQLDEIADLVRKTSALADALIEVVKKLEERIDRL
jgi:hypothetical protein